MRLYICIYMLVYFLLSCASIHTANHYVDKKANGANDGTSWEDAWESLSDIEWDQIQPGDIIYISGGTDSTVYNESLSVGADGTAANLITIRNGLDVRHTGQVIMQDDDPHIGTDIGISTVGREYIKIKGLTVKGWWKGIDTHSSNVIYLDSCKAFDNEWSFGLSLSGGESDSIFVWNCYIVGGWTTPNQTDCLGGTGITYLEVVGCFIKQMNRYSKFGHSDCIQVYAGGKQIYVNNWLESVGAGTDSSAAAGANCQVASNTDTSLWYNNVAIIRGWSPAFYYDAGTTDHTWIMYNNTFIKEWPYGPAAILNTIQFETFGKNNIFYNNTAAYTTFLNQTILSPSNANFDYNLWYHPNYSGIVNSYSLEEWQALGGDLNSIDGDPLFVDYPNGIDVRLTSNSPCIGTGTASVKEFIESWGFEWESFNNIYIPWAKGGARSETTPSIGAYEYVP